MNRAMAFVEPRKTGPRPRRHYLASFCHVWRRGHAPLCASVEPRRTGPRPRRHYLASFYHVWRRGHAPLCALMLLASATLAGEVRTLTILHLNDLHAHISPENGR